LAIEVERLPSWHRELYAAEVSFALNVVTGAAREIGRGLTRAQARALCGPDEMPGTADIVGLEGTDAVVVHDFKFGWGHVDPAAINWQVLTYALMACRAYGRDRAKVGIIRVASGNPWFEIADVGFFELERHEARVRALLAGRARNIELAQEGRWSEIPELVEGDHCTYCPAKKGCPAKVTLLAQWIEKIEQREAGKLGAPIVVTPENLPVMWQHTEMIEDLLRPGGPVWGTLKGVALTNPVDLPNGWRIGPKLKETKTIIPEKAEPAFIEVLGDEVGPRVYAEALEVRKSITGAHLKEVVRDRVVPSLPSREQRGALTRIVDRLWEAFTKHDAVKPDTTPDYVCKHKVPKPPKAKPEPEPEAGAAA
jgi:hypothetical protein